MLARVVSKPTACRSAVGLLRAGVLVKQFERSRAHQAADVALAVFPAWRLGEPPGRPDEEGENSAVAWPDGISSELRLLH